MKNSLPKIRAIVLAALVAVGVTAAVSTPAQAAPGGSRTATPTVRFIQAPALGQPALSWTGADGTHYQLQAITKEQAHADSTTKRALAASAATATVTATGFANVAAAPKPTKQADGGIHANASGCWYYSWYRGFGNGALDVDASEDWCGDGTWITYRSSDCWGNSWWPTYSYNSCSKQDTYGPGWNVSDLRVSWNACLAVVVWQGFCAWTWNGWDKYRFGGGGGVWYLGGS